MDCSTPHATSSSTPDTTAATSKSVEKVSRPALRWFSDWTSSRSSSSHSSPSQSLESLKEALQEPLPVPPPPARLPPVFQSARQLTRPPPLLSSLTRSTLPTSSLTRPPGLLLQQGHSTPTSSSIDTLRSVSKPLHTSSSLASPKSDGPFANWNWNWWSQESKNEDAADINTEDRRSPQREVQKRYLAPNNPVVFCHGLLGFDSVTVGLAIAPLEVVHWRGIKEALEENGVEVLITRVPATSSYVDRAKVLEQKISEAYPGRSVHLIGHSMGGLDCRYLTTHLANRNFRVLSVTTIATPHRGSSFADHFLDTIGMDRMPSVLSLLDLLPNGGGDGKAFECLTLESMKKFNEETPDVEGVRYFSWGAVYDPGLIDTWKWPHSVVLEREGPNDGLVSVESSKWGTYLGTLSDVNHLDLVGWINTARYKWAEMMGKEIKFRPATFYLGIADMLAREVEGKGKSETAQASPLTPDAGTAHQQLQMMDSLQTSGADVVDEQWDRGQNKSDSISGNLDQGPDGARRA